MLKLTWNLAGALSLVALALGANVANAADCERRIPDSALIKPGVLISAVNGTAPPRQYVENGKLVGMNIELQTAIIERLCLKPEFINMEFPALIPGLHSRRWDMLGTGLFYTAARAESMLMLPFSVDDVLINVQKGNPKKLKSIGDLEGTQIGTESGSYQDRQVKAVSDTLVAAGKRPIVIRGFDNWATAYAALAAGQIDGVAASGLVGHYYTQRGNFETGLRGIGRTGMAVAFINKTIADAVVWALGEVKKDGTYDAIHDKYGSLKLDSPYAVRTGEVKF